MSAATGAEIIARRVVRAIDGDAEERDYVRRIAETIDWLAVRPIVLRHRPGSAKIVQALELDAAAELDRLHENGSNGAGRDAPPKLDTYRLIDDLEAETLPPPEWGIEPIYPSGGLVLLFGPRGTGKTFLTLGFAFAHHTGEWLGHQAKPGSVVYILAEGRGGLGMRVRAQKDRLGIEGSAGIYFITQAVPTLDARETDRLIRTIKTLPEAPALIVWDTLSRTFIGGDENSAKDMALYVSHVDRVGEECGNPTRIVIHHSGHGRDERERGSSVLGGAADTILALRERDGALELACEKQKDAAEFSPILLQLEEASESRVISLHDGRGETAFSLTTVERNALRVLHDSFLDDGASTSAWMDAAEMPSSSFYKARTSLVRRDLVKQRGEGRGARFTLTPHGQTVLSLQSSTVSP